MRRVIFAVVVLASSLVLAQPVPESPPGGGKLFDEGRELAKQGKYAEACDKFTQSYALDPAVGTELNLADCHEHLGHVAKAWHMFDDAAIQSEKTTNAARAKFARERADALIGKLATIVIPLGAGNVAGATVTINKQTVKP